MRTILLLLVLQLPAALFSQSVPERLCLESINQVFGECECSSLAFFDYSNLMNNKPGCKGKLQRVDSVWLSRLQCSDTAFHILEPHVVKKQGEIWEVILSHYLFARNFSNPDIVFINDTHFYYSWNRGQNKFILLRKEERNEREIDVCEDEGGAVVGVRRSK